MKANVFFPFILLDSTCQSYTNLHVSSTGQNVPTCGTESTPCLDLTYTLTVNQEQTHIHWITCVVIHLSGSQQEYQLNGTTFGIGAPENDFGSHSHIPIKSSDQTDDVALTIQGIHFKHVGLEVHNISLNIVNCTFTDSSVSTYQSNSLYVSQSKWVNVTNTTILEVHDVEEVHMDNCNIMSTVIDSAEVNQAVILHNIQRLKMDSVIISGIQMTLHSDEVYKAEDTFCFMYIDNLDYENQLADVQIKNITVSFAMMELDTDRYRYSGNVLCTENASLSITESTFHDISRGKALHGSGCLDITNSTFSSTHPLNSFSGDTSLEWDTHYCEVDSNFTSSHFRDSGSLKIVNDKSTVRFKHCEFHGNEGGDLLGGGGAVQTIPRSNHYHSDQCGNRATVIIEDSLFANNTGGLSDAGAIYSETNLIIFNTTFIGNNGEDGGAIKISGVGNDCMVQLNMTQVKFYDNTAEEHSETLYTEWTQFNISGMDVYSWTVPYIAREPPFDHIQQVHKNGAQITLKHSMGFLSDVNFDFKLPVFRLYPQHIEYVQFTPPPYGPMYHTITGFGHGIFMRNISFICPRNYMATFTKFGSWDERCRTALYEDIFESHGLVNNCEAEFIRSCIRPSDGFYIADRGSYKLNLSIEIYMNNGPKPCPIPGGNCTGGMQLMGGFWGIGGLPRPMGGFWGPLVEHNIANLPNDTKLKCFQEVCCMGSGCPPMEEYTARFFKCIPGFCCSGSNCVDNTSCSIENNRAGILCTDCIQGFSHSLFGEKCIPNKSCGNIWPLIVIPIIILIIVTLSAFGALKVVSKIIGHVMFISKKINDMKRVIQKLVLHQMMLHFNMREQENTTMDATNSQNNGLYSKPHNENKNAKAQIAIIMCIVYYVQDVTLYHVDLAPYTSTILKNILNKRLIQNLFTLNAEIFKDVNTHSCVIVGLSLVSKVVLNSLFYYFILLSFGIVYVVLFWLFSLGTKVIFCRMVKRLVNDRSFDIKTNLASGFVFITMLSYQKVATLGLTLVNCVKVHNSVLLIDSGVECSKTKIVWVYIALCILPFPIYLMFILKSLKRKKLNLPTFFLGLLFPGVYFLSILFRFGRRRMAKLCCHHMISTSDAINDFRDQEDDVILNDVSNDDATFNNIANSNEGDQNDKNDNTESQTMSSDLVDYQQFENYGPSTDLYESLCNHIQGGYKAYLNGWLNWEGVILLLRMLLIYFSVFLQDPINRIGSMLAVSLMTCFLYCLLRPCTSKALNTLSIVCQACIITVGICYLILATLQRNSYLPPEEDPISGGLRLTINVLSVILPALGILMVLLDCVLSILVYLGKGVYKVGNLIVRKIASVRRSV